MDWNEVLNALDHLAISLHLESPLSRVVGAVSVGAVSAAVFVVWRQWRAYKQAAAELPMLSAEEQMGSHDTLLVMPDISGFGQFLSSAKGAGIGAASETIVSLLKAIIESVDSRLKVAKLEGDAVLFYADSGDLSREELGDVILGMFFAFDQRKRELEIETHLPGLSSLDLKVAVHSGQARKLSFRNSVDLVGADVVLVYRLLKLSLAKRRYIVATEEASQHIQWSLPLAIEKSEIPIAEFGNLLISIIDLPDPDQTNVKGQISKTIGSGENAAPVTFGSKIRRVIKERISA